MHLDFANALNLVSTVTVIGGLIFTGLQVRAGEAEFLEWCEWLATQIAQCRATRPYVPAYSRVFAGR